MSEGTQAQSEIRIGDLVQYRYSYRGLGGIPDNNLSMREVIEVVDGGARFVVEGFFNVEAAQIITHIPMHKSPDFDDVDTLES